MVNDLYTVKSQEDVFRKQDHHFENTFLTENTHIATRNSFTGDSVNHSKANTQLCPPLNPLKVLYVRSFWDRAIVEVGLRGPAVGSFL